MTAITSMRNVFLCEKVNSSAAFEIFSNPMNAHGDMQAILTTWYNGLLSTTPWGARYSWHKQELWKGRQSLLAQFGTTDRSGWGFKKNGLFNAWSAAEANAVADPHVFATNTVFNPTPASITNATATRLEIDMHLALGIPALSPATGSTNFAAGDDEIIPSTDLEMYRDPSSWPTQGRNPELQNKWLHSDIKDIAYLFTYELFYDIVQKGGLEP